MSRKAYLEAMFIIGLLAWARPATAQNDAAGAPARGLRSDEAFLNDALGVNELERRLGLLAMDRARSDEVRSAAAKMVDKHTSLGKQLGDLSRQAGGSGEPRMTYDQQETLEAMKAQPADSFDREFKKTVDDGHVRELAMYQDEVHRAFSPALRDLAEDRVTALEKALAGVTQPAKAAEVTGRRSQPVNSAPEGTGSGSGW